MSNFEEQQQQDDGLYTIGHQPSSSHVRFAIPGKASANALRDNLRQHLPLPYIKNEYGHYVAIEAISNNHLPNLQAKFWREIPKFTAESLSPLVFRSALALGVGNFIRGSTAVLEDDLRAASHVKMIAERLACKF